MLDELLRRGFGGRRQACLRLGSSGEEGEERGGIAEPHPITLGSIHRHSAQWRVHVPGSRIARLARQVVVGVAHVMQQPSLATLPSDCFRPVLHMFRWNARVGTGALRFAEESEVQALVGLRGWQTAQIGAPGTQIWRRRSRRVAPYLVPSDAGQSSPGAPWQEKECNMSRSS